MNKLFIICIDDEPLILESLKIQLREALGKNYYIETAASGSEALELVEEILEEEHEIAVVVSDYIMPDLKGDEVLKRIHELSPKTLKIMLTGQADLKAIENTIKHAKLYRYMAKPWAGEDLKLTVTEAIHSYLQDKKLTQKTRELEQANREQAELISQLQENESRLQQFLNAMPVGVFIVDVRGDVQYINSRAEQLLGQSQIEISAASELRERYRLYLAASDRVYPKERDPLLLALQGESATADDMEIRKETETIPLEVWGKPIYDRDGQAIYAIAAFQDISERKRAESVLADYNHTLEREVQERTLALQQEVVERQRAEEASRLSEEKFAKAFRSSPNAITLVNLSDGKHLEVNETFCQLTGYRPEEILGRSAVELNLWIDANDRDRFFEQLQQGKAVRNYEFDFRTRAGTTRTALLSAEIIELNGQKYLLSISSDISERKQVEEALRASEREIRTLVANIPGLVYRCLCDRDRTIVFMSDIARHITGYPSDDFLNNQVRSWASLIHPEDKTAALNALEVAVANRRPFVLEYRLLHACGEPRWVSERGQGVFAPDGQLLWLTGVIVDITAQKQAEQALQQKNEDLARALQQLKAAQNELIQAEKMASLGQLIAGVAHEINTPMGAIRASVGNISTSLDNSLRLLPQLLQRLEPHERADFFTLIEASCQTSEPISFREERKRKRALTKELEGRGVEEAADLASQWVQLGADGGIERFWSLLQSRDRQLILETASNLVIQHNNSENIKLAVERAAKIVFALKSYARQDDSGQMTRADVTQGIDVVLTIYHNLLKRGIEVNKTYQNVVPILCYPEELNQVWTNLIHNAIQAMNAVGRLDIDISPQGDGLLVEFTDSGPGIPPEIQDRIFEPFFTTKPAGEGSGLGLDIVRKIVDKHQGDIHLKSEPGRTTFGIWLPAHPPGEQK
ncbi:MAG: PAS domain S-box protein [Cyanobacteriota bacterium]|nr:PAS domain S-box protein [Cyanobacteriota bacterium]